MLAGGLALGLFAAAFSSAAIPDGFATRNFFGDVTFDRPLWIGEVPGHDSVYAVAQQFGGIALMRHESGGWVKERFDSVSVALYPSRPDNDGAGLLGMTFHPDYEENGKYYVQYNMDYELSPRPGTLVIAERTADASGLEASGDAEKVILSLKKPRTTHDGGTLRFGDDGYLYLGLGDGGNISSGDPENRAQSPDSLFGKILRLDVDGSDDHPDDPTRNYAIPEDNPLTDSAGHATEVWALGLRNPWRWSFHPETGDIWAGDVGHTSREEVSRITKGDNLGWRIWEGNRCLRSSCPTEGITEPVMVYERDEGSSVTGGVFYDNPDSPFDGLYIFGDYAVGVLWAMREDDGEMVEYAPIDSAPSLVSIHQDTHGQVFVVSLSQEWNYSGDWINTGSVQILEFPDVTSLAPGKSPRPELADISLSDVLRNRGDYIVRGLDGRVLRGAPSGMAVVHEKGFPSIKRLMMFP